MALDPQVEGLLQTMAAEGNPPIHTLPVPEARAAAEGLTVLSGEQVPVGSVRGISIPVGDGVVGARVYTPEGDGPHPGVMFFHGGGWVICSLDTHDNICRTICRDAEAVVVSVDYRMAPEFRYPTAVHDCFGATKWVSENAASLDIDAGRLAVSGDSAGGNLSAVVTQMARDAGGPAIAFAALIYPAVDMTRKGGSLDENASGYFLETEGMEWFMGHYLTDAQRAEPLASPLLHENLAGLPDTFIATCEFDPLRDEGEAYGDALRASGGHVTTKRYDGLIHGVANMSGALDGGRQLVEDTAAHIRAALHP
ncbi:MAG TPA: alpha/beta hydrolase [Ilumatobacteraceae bacterium]|jgi:acetyl esterase|nr:alpha/beta hydrolase [Ilumatobacteraceae bacterium]